MTKVTIKLETLANLAETVSASVLDGIRITVRPKAKDGKNYISLSACDRSCQTETLAECKTDVEEVTKFIVDKTFVTSVKALQQTGEDVVTIRFTGNGVTLKAGSAQVEAAIRSDMTTFADCDPADAVAKIVVDTAEFISAVKKGGFAYSMKGCRMEAFNDAVAFVPWAEGEKSIIKVFSVNGSNTIVAARNMAVEQGSEALKTCFDENKAWFVNASYLFRILSHLQAEKTQLIVWNKQLMIRNGNTFYCCILGSSAGYKRSILVSMFQKETERTFAMALDVKKLRSAMEIAGAGIRTLHNEGAVMEFILKEKKVLFTSFGGGSKMSVDCDQAMGEAHMAVSLEYLKKVLAQISGSKILLSGSAGHPILIGDCDKEGRILLAPHQTREQQDQQEQQEDEDEEKVEKGA